MAVCKVEGCTRSLFTGKTICGICRHKDYIEWPCKNCGILINNVEQAYHAQMCKVCSRKSANERAVLANRERCVRLRRVKNCLVCGESLMFTGKQKFCSKECWKYRHKMNRREERLAKKMQTMSK